MKRFLLCILALEIAAPAFGSITTTPSASGSGSVTSTVTFTDYTALGNNGGPGWKVHMEAFWTGSEPSGNTVGLASAGPVSSPAMNAAGPTSYSGTSTGYVTPGSTITHSVYLYNLGNVYYANSEQLTVPTAPQQQYKVTVSIFNSRDVPVKYRLMQGTTQIGEVELQPGTGLIQTFTTNSPEPVSVLELIPGLSKDGDTWVVVDGAVTTRTVASGITPTPVSPGDPNPPAVPVPAAPDVPTVTKPDAKPPAAPVWRSSTPNNNPTGQVDLVTNSVFREGVSKVIQSIDVAAQKQYDLLNETGQTKTAAEYPQTFADELSAKTGDVTTGLIAKLPIVPQVLPGTIGKDSHFRFTLKFPPLTQDFPVDVDMAAYATPIAFVRGVMLGCLSLLFFLLVVNTLKKAVA